MSCSINLNTWQTHSKLYVKCSCSPNRFVCNTFLSAAGTRLHFNRQTIEHTRAHIHGHSSNQHVCMRSTAWRCRARKPRRRRDRDCLARAARGMRASRSDTRAASQAFERMHNTLSTWNNTPSPLTILGVADVRRQSACARSKAWRCRARVTPARSPSRAHAACITRLG